MELSTKVEGVAIGTLAALDASGRARVQTAGGMRRARTIVPLAPEHVGRSVVLAFEEGDPSKAVILGIVQDPAAAPAVQARVDGETIQIDGRKEIVLKCGKASITLTRAGKVLIRGTYVLNRSSGMQRIQGGSVQIN
jgi:hypothetical protein